MIDNVALKTTKRTRSKWIRWWNYPKGLLFIWKLNPLMTEHLTGLCMQRRRRIRKKQLIETYRFIYRSLSSSTENTQFFFLLCLQGTDVKRIQLNLINFFLSWFWHFVRSSHPVQRFISGLYILTFYQL